MTRKDFIVNTCALCASATGMAALLNSCTPSHYISGTMNNDGLILSRDEFKIMQKGNTAYRSFIIVRNDALKFPICVFRINDTEYSALWMQCTHQGAE